MGAVIALTGRIVDLAANLTLPSQLPEDGREQIRLLAENVGSVRSALLLEGAPHLDAVHVTQRNVRGAIPFVSEMEKTVQLMREVLTASQSLSVFAPQPSSGDPAPTFFVRDALTNVAHIQFALKGCLTASLCYIIYTGVDWPGISTAVTTCFPHRAFYCRFVSTKAGAAHLRSPGGWLPYWDGLTDIHPALSGFDCRIHHSFCHCHRLRFLVHDFQRALVILWRADRRCFYLIHLNSFAIEPSLSIARDSCRRHLARIDHDMARLDHYGEHLRSQT